MEVSSAKTEVRAPLTKRDVIPQSVERLVVAPLAKRDVVTVVMVVVVVVVMVVGVNVEAPPSRLT